MTVRLGVIGMGFMGATHARACQLAEGAGLPCHLAAVADASAERLAHLAAPTGNIPDAGAESLRLDDVARYADATSLLADGAIDAVSICTPTRTHIDLAIQALRAGKHVLIEKPLALSSEEARRLLQVADASPALICMPAMCMRFWPGWDWLKQAIDQRHYGAVRSASFQRLASRPTWSEFYRRDEETGGALFDLHIHDADFIHWCFGAPSAVATTGTAEHLTALYVYGDDGPLHVAAEGGWDQHPGSTFRMRYVVNFEHATADFDLDREPALLLVRDGQAEAVALAPLNGWHLGLRAFIEAVAAGGPAPVSVADAIGVLELLERERAAGLRGVTP